MMTDGQRGVSLDLRPIRLRFLFDYSKKLAHAQQFSATKSPPISLGAKNTLGNSEDDKRKYLAFRVYERALEFPHCALRYITRLR